MYSYYLHWLTQTDSGCRLPWWCVYVGYALALCVVGVAFFITVEVAGVFGAEKSARWLTSFCISIIESIFLSQPIKVCLNFIPDTLNLSRWVRPSSSQIL